MRLSREQKEKIKSLLGRMGARQKELCTESGYASGNMSDFLSLSKNKGGNPETWARIVDAMERMANKPHRKQLGERDPSILTDVVDIRCWSDKNGSSDEGMQSSYRPNDNSSYARPHVKRQAEKDIPLIVQTAPGSVIVRGAASTGRSSWLSYFHEAAVEDGARVGAFDEGTLLELRADDPVKGFCHRLAEELGLPALSEIDTSKGDYRAVAREILIVLRQAPRDTALFLLIDDVGAWPDAEDFGALTAVIEQMQLQLVGRWGQRQAPPICVVSALSPRGWPALFGSRLETQSRVVSLPFLTQEQVRHLANHYGFAVEIADTIRAVAAPYGAVFISVAETVGEWARHNRVPELTLVGISYVAGLGEWSAYRHLTNAVKVEPLSEKGLERIHELGYQVKQQGATEAGRNKLRSILNDEARTSHVVIALTELSILLDSQKKPGKTGRVIVDALKIYGDEIADAYIGMSNPRELE